MRREPVACAWARWGLQTRLLVAVASKIPIVAFRERGWAVVRSVAYQLPTRPARAAAHGRLCGPGLLNRPTTRPRPGVWEVGCRLRLATSPTQPEANGRKSRSAQSFLRFPLGLGAALPADPNFSERRCCRSLWGAACSRTSARLACSRPWSSVRFSEVLPNPTCPLYRLRCAGRYRC